MNIETELEMTMQNARKSKLPTAFEFEEPGRRLIVARNFCFCLIRVVSRINKHKSHKTWSVLEPVLPRCEADD
jgi:hypothetical protein